MGNKWVSVEDRKPGKWKKLIAYGLNSMGYGRRVMAQYIPPRTVFAEDFLDEDEWCLNDADGSNFLVDYEKENDQYWVSEGWFEDSEEAEIQYRLTLDITHWMELPDKPKELLEGVG